MLRRRGEGYPSRTRIFRTRTEQNGAADGDTGIQDPA